MFNVPHPCNHMCMRKARNNQPDSFHHVHVRTSGELPVFQDDGNKRFLQHCLWEHGTRHDISILAWCILPDGYHLVLRDGLCRMSRFMKEVNGRFGSHFRRHYGGDGVVFHDRFKSEEILDSGALAAWIVELMLLPVRENFVQSPDHYPWSSIHEVFPAPEMRLCDAERVERLFGEAGILIEFIRGSWGVESLQQAVGQRRADILAYLGKMFRRLRGRVPTLKQLGGKVTPPVTARDVIQAFEAEFSTKVSRLEESGWETARLRGELLVRLRDDCGLTYQQIHKHRPFKQLELNSLGNLYRRARARREE